MKNEELKAVVFHLDLANLVDPNSKFEVVFYPATENEEKIKRAAQVAIEANHGKWALGYHVEIFSNETGEFQTAFNINY
ncbi:MAG TPA: hypothetical protein VGE79_11950 [Niastella sp.]